MCKGSVISLDGSLYHVLYDNGQVEQLGASALDKIITVRREGNAEVGRGQAASAAASATTMASTSTRKWQTAGQSTADEKALTLTTDPQNSNTTITSTVTGTLLQQQQEHEQPDLQTENVEAEATVTDQQTSKLGPKDDFTSTSLQKNSDTVPLSEAKPPAMVMQGVEGDQQESISERNAQNDESHNDSSPTMPSLGAAWSKLKGLFGSKTEEGLHNEEEEIETREGNIGINNSLGGVGQASSVPADHDDNKESAPNNATAVCEDASLNENVESQHEKKSSQEKVDKRVDDNEEKPSKRMQNDNSLEGQPLSKKQKVGPSQEKTKRPRGLEPPGDECTSSTFAELAVAGNSQPFFVKLPNRPVSKRRLVVRTRPKPSSMKVSSIPAIRLATAPKQYRVKPAAAPKLRTWSSWSP